MATKQAKKAMPQRGQRAAKSLSNAPMLGGPSKAQEKKWQAQDDLGALKRAAEIKADPARVKAAQAEAQAQMKALQTVVKK